MTESQPNINHDRIALINSNNFLNSLGGEPRNLKGRLVHIENDVMLYSYSKEGYKKKDLKEIYRIRQVEEGATHSNGGFCWIEEAEIIDEDNLEESLRIAYTKTFLTNTIGERLKFVFKKSVVPQDKINKLLNEYKLISSLRD